MSAAGQPSTETGSHSADRVGVRIPRFWGVTGMPAPDRRRVTLTLTLSALVVALGVSVLIGWALDMALLKSWLADSVQTKVNAALCLLLLGAAAGLAVAAPGRLGTRMRAILALAALAIAGATLLEHAAAINLGIDQFFVADAASAAAPHPGRFAVQTAVGFIGAALAILAAGRRFRGLYVAEALAVVCGIVGGVGLMGYLFGAGELLSLGSATQVSLPASVGLVAVAAAIITSDPNHGLVELWRDAGIAGQVFRRFLPAVVLVLPAGAWLRLVGERAGLYDENIGLSIMVVFEALILVAVGAWTTVRVHALEIERQEALSGLLRLGAAAATPLIETAPVGLAVLDRELRCLYVNPAFAAICGISSMAGLGQHVDRLLPALGGHPMAMLSRVAAAGAALREVEITGPARPGGVAGAWLLGAEPLSDSDGEPSGLTLSIVDITERKRREEAIAAAAELRRQAQAIGESIPFGIWLAEADGRMRYLSESMLEMSGQTMDQARDFGWMATLAPESAEETRRDLTATIASRTPWNHELVICGADGRRRTILSRGFPISNGSGAVTSWAGINLDITDRKDAEAFRESFLGILSHEIGTPITSIFAASTLLSRAGLDDARRTDLVGDIGHEAERLGRLVEDLVILARAERGTIQVHTEPVLLQHVLPKVCEQERRRWPDCRVELTMASPLPVARAEEAFVEQIARNLLDNAAKYGPADGPIEVVVDALDGWPRVRVLDRGPGIDPVEADRLFEVFYRSGRTSNIAGSGIGLFVVHRLVESVGGTVWARPRDDGPGAEFGFRLQPLTEDLV
jgi:PAS domain S-box-containing protein